MSKAASPPLYTDRSSRALVFALLFVVASVAVHVVGFYGLDLWVSSKPPPEREKVMELVVIEVKPPPPPEVKEEPPPPPPPVKLKPPPVKVAAVLPPKEVPKDLPPPPNEEPPPETPPKIQPLIVGISMSSTSATGNFNAPVGNTQYGRTAERAAKPEEVMAYVAPKYMPVYQVDSPPEVMSDYKPPYPEEARKVGIEGQVIIAITVDNEGRVVNAKMVRGLGYGLDEAALLGIKRFKFKPAFKSGEAVSTTFNYTFNFLLD